MIVICCCPFCLILTVCLRRQAICVIFTRVHINLGWLKAKVTKTGVKKTKDKKAVEEALRITSRKKGQ